MNLGAFVRRELSRLGAKLHLSATLDLSPHLKPINKTDVMFSSHLKLMCVCWSAAGQTNKHTKVRGHKHR